MNPVLAKVLKKTFATSATVVGALFVVYFWNLDQKLMGWVYKQVNTMFDAIRKKVDEAEKGFRTNGKTKLFSFSDEPTSCGEWTVKAGERIGISLKVINDCNMSIAPNKLEVETFPDGSEPDYYELFNSEGMLCCCDGEVVTVVRTGVDENGIEAAWLYATDSNGETGPEFSLPIEALKVGVFR